MRALLEDWRGLSLPEKTLYQIFAVAGLLNKEHCNFYQFLAVACGFLGYVSYISVQKLFYVHMLFSRVYNIPIYRKFCILVFQYVVHIHIYTC